MKFDRPAAETAPWVLSVEDAAWACRFIGPVPISGDAHPGLVPRQRWKWTCQECGATGPMPEDILAPQHDCKSRGPFDEVSRLLVEPVTESGDGFCMECGMFCTNPEHDAPGSSVAEQEHDHRPGYRCWCGHVTPRQFWLGSGSSGRESGGV